MGNNGSLNSQDSGYLSSSSITKDVHHYVRSGMVKTTSINFAQQAKRSASVGESAWKRLVGRRKRSKVIPSQSMPENVNKDNGLHSHSTSTYNIQVEPMLDQSIVSRLPKSSSVSGLSVIHRNINNRIPSSKTNHQIYPPPPPNPPISARTTNENDRKITLSGSTSEMLRCLATFVNTRIEEPIEPSKIIMWLKNVDRQLLIQGWQDTIFMGPTALVLMFLLVRNDLPRRDPKLTTEDIRSKLLTCLYITYSYAGPEISYPVKPFTLSTESQDDFWNRCLHLSLRASDQMLRLASDPQYFARCFKELKFYQYG